MGRVNYGHKLTAPTQSKGLGRGVMADPALYWKLENLSNTT